MYEPPTAPGKKGRLGVPAVPPTPRLRADALLHVLRRTHPRRLSLRRPRLGRDGHDRRGHARRVVGLAPRLELSNLACQERQGAMNRGSRISLAVPCRGWCWERCPKTGFGTTRDGYFRSKRGAVSPPLTALGGRQPYRPGRPRGCRPPLSEPKGGGRRSSGDRRPSTRGDPPGTPPRNNFVPPASHSNLAAGSGPRFFQGSTHGQCPGRVLYP